MQLGNLYTERKRTIRTIVDEVRTILSKEKLNIFNLGVNDYCEVNESIKWICDELGLKPQLRYTGGEKGWVGDNPFIFLETKKISNLGWQPKNSIKKSIIKTLKYLKKNEWVFDSRL
jgi:UDP-glucose 4-epimerase